MYRSDEKPVNDILFARDVEYKVHNPCADCPFLKSSPFHEGVAGSIPEMIESMVDHNFAHTCHKTDNRLACDGPRNHQGTTQHCAGALMMLLKTGKGFDLQLPLLEAAQAGKIDLKEWTARAIAAKNVFTVKEMLDYYAKRLGQRVRRERVRKAKRRR